MNKDKLGLELKSIMEEEAKDIYVSNELINKILEGKKKTWKDKVREFLNKEIEIPLAPAIIGIAALFIITFSPIGNNTMEKNKDVRIINIGSSQIILREVKEVSLNERK